MMKANNIALLDKEIRKKNNKIALKVIDSR
jgi:hypothetical protein